MSAERSLYAKGIDIPSLQRNWPDGREIPPVIIEIATLLESQTWGAVGYLEMTGARFDDYWIEGGADLSHQFGVFIKFADGTKVAQWFHPGAVTDAEPIVSLGSEGDLQILAPNLKSFLRSWANGEGCYDLSLDPDDRTPAKLAEWQAVADRMQALINAAPDSPPSSPVPDLAGLMDSYGAASRQAMRANPIHQEIARVMAAHIPHRQEAWVYYNAAINIAGSRIEILTPAQPPDYREREPLPERDALIPLLLKIREERAQANIDRGLWHSASLRLHADGLVWIPADWECEPSFETGGRITRAELEADLSRFPRSNRWRQPWMDELI
jgi:hypothetical protein